VSLTFFHGQVFLNKKINWMHRNNITSSRIADQARVALETGSIILVMHDGRESWLTRGWTIFLNAILPFPWNGRA
jgi:hypothetical protein